MKRTLNQTTLKWIALASMLIDHIGVVFFEHVLLLRMVGRLAFPIYAFLVARGFQHTHNRTNYLLRMLAFGALSILPYYWVFGSFFPNILFTFALSIVLMWVFDAIRKMPLNHSLLEKIIRTCLLFLWVMFVAAIATVFLFEYSFLGVLLPFVFWILEDFSQEKFTAFAMLTVLYTSLSILDGFTALNALQLVSLFAIPLLGYSSQTQSKRQFKWLFYVFYPLHLLVLHIISLF